MNAGARVGIGLLDGVRHFVIRMFKDLRSCNKPVFVLFCSCHFVFLRALTGAGYSVEDQAHPVSPSSWAKWGQLLHRVEWARNPAPNLPRYVHEFLERATSTTSRLPAETLDAVEPTKTFIQARTTERRLPETTTAFLDQQYSEIEESSIPEPPELIVLDDDAVDPPQYEGEDGILSPRANLEDVDEDSDNFDEPVFEAATSTSEADLAETETTAVTDEPPIIKERLRKLRLRDSEDGSPLP